MTYDELDKAEKILSKTGYLSLEKQCRHEKIIICFACDKDNIVYIISKQFWDSPMSPKVISNAPNGVLIRKTVKQSKSNLKKTKYIHNDELPMELHKALKLVENYINHGYKIRSIENMEV